MAILEITELKRSTVASAWIQTYSGRAFPLLEPMAADVSILDIAHALSNLCRFAGHTRCFYSVAQHSVLVSSIVPPQWALQGLLHDAPEAYIVDLPRPLKRSGLIDGYRAVEERIWAAIAARFGVDPVMAPEVKEADSIALFTEQRNFMGRQAKPWKDPVPPLAETLVAWSPAEAKARFLDRFGQLYGAKDERTVGW